MSIAVFDSGVGGISVLKSLVEVMPNEDFIYYGDSANAPYGTKTLEQVRALTCEHAKELILNQAKQELSEKEVSIPFVFEEDGHYECRIQVEYSHQRGSAYIKRTISRCSYRRDRACSQACDAFYGKSESACDGYTYDYQGGKT